MSSRFLYIVVELSANFKNNYRSVDFYFGILANILLLGLAFCFNKTPRNKIIFEEENNLLSGWIKLLKVVRVKKTNNFKSTGIWIFTRRKSTNFDLWLEKRSRNFTRILCNSSSDILINIKKVKKVLNDEIHSLVIECLHCEYFKRVKRKTCREKNTSHWSRAHMPVDSISIFFSTLKREFLEWASKLLVDFFCVAACYWTFSAHFFPSLLFTLSNERRRYFLLLCCCCCLSVPMITYIW